MLIYDVRNLYTSIQIKYGKNYKLDCDVLENAFHDMLKIACVCHNKSDSLNFKFVLSDHNFVVKSRVFANKTQAFLDNYCTMMVASELYKAQADELHVISQSPLLVPIIQALKDSGKSVKIYGVNIPYDLSRVASAYEELDGIYFVEAEKIKN